MFTGVAGHVGVRPEGLGFIRCRCDRWESPWGSSDLSGVARFIGVHPRDRRVFPRSQGSLGCALSVLGFILSRWVH